eukprot:403351203
MFNVYKHERLTTEEELQNSTMDKMQKRSISLKKRNDQLSQNYKLRVGQFIKKVELSQLMLNEILQMLAEPIESVRRNSIYETNPTQLCQGKTQEQLMNLRPREIEKELGPPSFRYGNKSTIERIYETLSKRNNSIMEQGEILEKKTLKQLKNRQDTSNQNNQSHNNSLINQSITVGTNQYRSRQQPSDLFPEIVKPTDLMSKLHNKTHFKAAQSIFMNLQGSLEDQDKTLEKVLNDFTVKRNLQQILSQPQKAENFRIKFKNTKTPDPTRNRTNYMSTRNTTYSLGLSQANVTMNTINTQDNNISNLKSMIEQEGRTISPNLVTQQMLLNCKVIRMKNTSVQPLQAKSKITSNLLLKNGLVQIRKIKMEEKQKQERKNEFSDINL